jgi:protein required for attachment to host cells
MKVQCVLVADGARARLFTIDHPEDDMESGPTLTEHVDLANPEGELTGKEMFANSKSGRNQAPGNGPAHGYDDHRAGHRDEIARRFAKTVANETRDFMKAHGTSALVLVAEPHLLGLLRDHLDDGIQPTEIASDLSWHDAQHVRDALVRHGVMPARQTGNDAYRPRGQPPSRR